MSNIKGHVLKYGDNINTDIISPPQYMELSIADAAKYAMSAVDPIRISSPESKKGISWWRAPISVPGRAAKPRR